MSALGGGDYLPVPGGALERVESESDQKRRSGRAGRGKEKTTHLEKGTFFGDGGSLKTEKKKGGCPCWGPKQLNQTGGVAGGLQRGKKSVHGKLQGWWPGRQEGSVFGGEGGALPIGRESTCC